MPDSTIFTVFCEDPGGEARRISAECGIDEETLISALGHAVTDIAHICADAARATIPWDTEQLRDAITIEDDSMRTGSKYSQEEVTGTGKFQKRVEIQNGVHSSSETHLMLNNITLANILDEGVVANAELGQSSVFRKTKRMSETARLHRRQGSLGSGMFSGGLKSKGSETAKWVQDAQDLALQNIDKEN